MVGIDELLGRGRGFGKDAQPGEGIEPLIDCQNAVGDARTADAVEAVASGDKIAFDLVWLTVFRVLDRRPGFFNSLDAQVADLEQNLTVDFEAGLDEVLDDLVLSVHGDGAAGQVLEVDAMALSSEAQL